MPTSVQVSRPLLFVGVMSKLRLPTSSLTSLLRRPYTISTNNAAAWITAVKSKPFEIKSAPLWTLKENEILVRNYAVAINPVNGGLQSLAFFPLDYPTILEQASPSKV